MAVRGEELEDLTAQVEKSLSFMIAHTILADHIIMKKVIT